MASYDYSVSANNNNATYSVVLKPYLNGNGNHCIQTRQPLNYPSGGVNMTGEGDVSVNNATNGTSPINCTLQIKDTTNLYTTTTPYSKADTTVIADGVVTTQDDGDEGAVADGNAAVLQQLTEGRVNDLLARIVANWEGIITDGQTSASASTTATNCPIKNIFLRITV